MKITIERRHLLPVLNIVDSVVEKRQVDVILANLYFHHEKGRLTIIGTDLEVEISITITEGVQGDTGSFTVSSDKISNIARKLPEDAVISFQFEDDNILVSAARSKYRLNSLNADGFPRIEEGENWEERFKIDELSLKSLFEKTSFAMAVRDVRYYLNGVLLELGEGKLVAVATDGHRLAQTDTDISLDAADTRQIIVPRKAVTEMIRVLGADGSAEELTLEISANHMKITRQDMVLITKLIDGRFPEFKGVLETEANIALSINRSRFTDTLNRMAILTTERYKGVKITLDEGMMRLTASNPEHEEALEDIELDYSGETVETGYNIDYLIDVATVVDSEDIEIHLQGNEGMCIIKQPNDPRSTWLTMPMRI